jgi:hypothetical protein
VSPLSVRSVAPTLTFFPRAASPLLPPRSKLGRPCLQDLCATYKLLKMGTKAQLTERLTAFSVD